MLVDLWSCFGGETHTDISVLAIKKKAAKALDSPPLKDINSNIQSYDTDGNGWITADDCEYEHGSPQAKLWWQHVSIPAMKITKAMPEAIPYQQQYGNHFHGFYNGHPVISGIHSNVGNIQYITDRLMIVQGMSHSAAQNAADYINNNIIIGE